MKTTLKFLAVLFIATTISSCGSKGVDQATKDAIAKFDADWSAMLANSMEFVSSLQTSIDDMTQKHQAMRTEMSDMTEDQMALLRADMEVCMKTESDAKALHDAAVSSINDWTQAQTDNWTEGTGWEDWKKDVEEKKVNQEDATKLLEEWNAKLTEANTAIQKWNDDWSAMNLVHIAAEANMTNTKEGIN